MFVIIFLNFYYYIVPNQDHTPCREGEIYQSVGRIKSSINLLKDYIIKIEKKTNKLERQNEICLKLLKKKNLNDPSPPHQSLNSSFNFKKYPLLSQSDTLNNYNVMEAPIINAQYHPGYRGINLNNSFIGPRYLPNYMSKMFF